MTTRSVTGKQLCHNVPCFFLQRKTKFWSMHIYRDCLGYCKRCFRATLAVQDLMYAMAFLLYYVAQCGARPHHLCPLLDTQHSIKRHRRCLCSACLFSLANCIPFVISLSWPGILKRFAPIVYSMMLYWVSQLCLGRWLQRNCEWHTVLVEICIFEPLGFTCNSLLVSPLYAIIFFSTKCWCASCVFNPVSSCILDFVALLSLCFGIHVQQPGWSCQ